MHSRDGRKNRCTQPQTRIVHPRSSQSQGGAAHGAVRRRRGGGAGRRGDARRLLHHPDLTRGARTPTHDRPAKGLRHREILVLRGASRPFGGAGSHALSARIGAHADGRGSRGTVSAAAHRPPAGRIPISPPAGAPEPDRSLLRHRHAPAGGLPVAGSRRDSVARIIRMGGHRAVLLRRRALCRPGGSEGGAAQARGADTPAEQSPQPLRAVAASTTATRSRSATTTTRHAACGTKATAISSSKTAP